MRTAFDEQLRAQLVDRIKRLTPETPRQWGSMTSAQMVAHLTDALKMTFGELEVRPKKGPLRYPPLKQIIIYAAPFPKGAPTAPELIVRSAEDWELEVKSLIGLLSKFSESGLRFAVEHPAFGKMSAKDWGVLVYRHTDHHLRQFGV